REKWFLASNTVIVFMVPRLERRTWAFHLCGGSRRRSRRSPPHRKRPESPPHASRIMLYRGRKFLPEQPKRGRVVPSSLKSPSSPVVSSEAGMALAEGENAARSSRPHRGGWWEGISRYQWLVLLVAWMGWVFDSMDATLYVVVLTPALRELLGAGANDATI